jgi:hypothetical protein
MFLTTFKGVAENDFLRLPDARRTLKHIFHRESNFFWWNWKPSILNTVFQRVQSARIIARIYPSYFPTSTSRKGSDVAK